MSILSRIFHILSATVAVALVASPGVTLPASAQVGGLPVGWHATPPVIEIPVSPIGPNTGPTPPYSPANVDGFYGVNNLSSLPNPTGAGVTIAIVDAYGDTDAGLTDYIQSDLQAFCTKYSLPYTGPGNGATLTEAFPDGTPTSNNDSWALETALDVEWVHAVAPDAKILLVTAINNSSSLYSCITYANSHASVVSMSWGGGEFNGETTYDSTYFNAANVTYFASTGDNGSGTEYPSASKYVTAIGGTTISIASGNIWSSETGWSGSGGGLCTNETYQTFQSSWIASGNRQVPDVSAIADPNTGVFVKQAGGDHQVGGTSLACPVWAAIVGILDANLSTPINEANLHLLLYTYGNSTNLATYFHDITSGTNGGFSCATGYDEVTGIGAPKVDQLLPAVTPLAPASPQATAGPAQATISWTASTLATSYNLYRGTTPGGESATPVKTGLTGTQVTDTSLSNGTTYYYKVAAVTAYCTSLLSSEVSATPTPNTYATYVGNDTTTQGSWKGVYGDAGWNVINDTSGNNPTYPGGVTVTPGTHNSGVWAASSINANALQKAAVGAADRTAGVWYNTTWSTTIDTTSPQTVSLYLVDYNNAGYAETISVRDEHNNLLDTKSASNFSGGVYYTWTIYGHVTFTFTSTAGHWAVLNGIFFGHTPGATAPAAPTWTSPSVYGSQAFLSWSASSGATSYKIYRGTASGSETQIATGITGTTYTNTGLTGGTTYYYRVVAVNAVGGSPGSTEVILSATTTAASFVGTDANTQGSWKGAYGGDGWNVINDTSGNNPSYPGYAVVTPGAHNSGTWATSTFDARCLEKTSNGSLDRMIGVWYQTSWTLNVKVSANSQQLALYFDDFNNAGYAETVTLRNEAGGVLDTQTVSSFQGGKYYVWNVVGNVTITFTSTAGHWAVLNGIFFGGGTGQHAPQSTTVSAMPFGNKAVLSWGSSSGATSYNVYRGTTPGHEGTTPRVTGITGNSYIDTNLTPGTTYYYQVVAVNAVGGSPGSNEASAAASANSASFLGSDTSTKGSWKGVYGADGWNVFQDASGNNPTYPAYVNFTPGAHNTGTWVASGSATQLLQKSAVDATDRIGALWYQTTWSSTLSVSTQHRVSLYFLDYTNAGYAETITIKDAQTGAVLDTESVSNFSGGIWYSWNLNGNVIVTLTSTAGHWAPLSGIFFG